MAEIKKGALRKQLGIPAHKHVPKTVIKKITDSKVGKVITNPTATGFKKITVTKKLKKRAFFVRSFYEE